MTRDWLILPGGSGPTSRCFDILCTVAQERGYTVPELRGPARNRALTEARREVIRRATLAGMSASRIGHVMHRDHTTILHHQRVLGLR